MERFEPIRLLRTHLLYLAMGILLCSGQGWADQPSLGPTTQEEVLELSLEDLLNVEVTSVSKKAQSLSDAAAAIFVITKDDLRRSGVTNIPDALRMVPGLNIARIDSNKWADGSRGFSGLYAYKLLVLIDGRSVQSALFSGVQWEVQDVMLEDVERIEVIRGPGATLWGTNAVSGVINIITKHTAETQGSLLTLGAGSEERGFGGVRYGMVLGESTYGRVYFKGLKRDEFVHRRGGYAGDDWDMLRSGFRVDSRLSDCNAMTIQGDIYKGNISQTLELATVAAPFSYTIHDKADVSGRNLVARWQHTLSSTSEFTIQAYYDMSDRDEAFEREVRDTFDIDLQHRFALGERHDIIWGLEYQYTSDDITNSPIMTFDPDSSSDNLFGAFMQDEITLMEDRLWLTLGSKFERNHFTDSKIEIQPNVRLLWAPHRKHRFWTAISKAVRTSSRAENDIWLFNIVVPPFSLYNDSYFPLAITIVGDSDCDSTDLWAYELGYRVLPAIRLSLDLAAFYHAYDGLRTLEKGASSSQDTHIEQQLMFANNLKGEAYGAELTTVWQAFDWWRLDLAYSYLNTHIDIRSILDKLQNTDGPRHQVSLRSAINIRKEVDLDIWLRYVDEVKVVNSRDLSRLKIDGYITLDVRLAWRPCDNVEISLVGQNLVDDEHMEYVQVNFTLPTQIERSVYGKLTWRF